MGHRHANLNPRSPMCWRTQWLGTLFEQSAPLYARFKRSEAWNLSARELLEGFPPGSLGQALGLYLEENGFALLPKLESHDVFHVLTATPTDVVSEVGLQFLLWGNGKSSPYMWGTMLLGGLMLPEHAPYFLKQHQRGERLRRFYNWNVRDLLQTPLSTLQMAFGGDLVKKDMAASTSFKPSCGRSLKRPEATTFGPGRGRLEAHGMDNQPGSYSAPGRWPTRPR